MSSGLINRFPIFLGWTEWGLLASLASLSRCISPSLHGHWLSSCERNWHCSCNHRTLNPRWLSRPLPTRLPHSSVWDGIVYWSSGFTDLLVDLLVGEWPGNRQTECVQLCRYVYVCLYLSMYVYICLCLSISVCQYLSTFRYLCLSISFYNCLYLCMSIFMYTVYYVCWSISVCVCVCVRVRGCTFDCIMC